MHLACESEHSVFCMLTFIYQRHVTASLSGPDCSETGEHQYASDQELPGMIPSVERTTPPLLLLLLPPPLFIMRNLA